MEVTDAQLRALPRAVEALRFGQIVLNPLHAWPNEPTYELRLAKYAARGFVVGFFGACVDVEPSGICERVEKASRGRVRRIPFMIAIATGMGAGASFGAPQLAADLLMESFSR